MVSTTSAALLWWFGDRAMQLKKQLYRLPSVEPEWERLLPTPGVRGTSEMLAGTGQWGISASSRLIDGFMALPILARHPKVEAERLGISGYGIGRWMSLYSSNEKLAKAVGPEGTRFAAHRRGDALCAGQPVRSDAKLLPHRPTPAANRRRDRVDVLIRVRGEPVPGTIPRLSRCQVVRSRREPVQPHSSAGADRYTQ